MDLAARKIRDADSTIAYVQCDGLGAKVKNVSDLMLIVTRGEAEGDKQEISCLSPSASPLVTINMRSETFFTCSRGVFTIFVLDGGGKRQLSFKVDTFCTEAVMKMVKHCHEESSSNMDIAQGALLGLVVDNRLEITNCFPFPKHNDETMDEEEYQLAMMRRLRRVNVDHFHVGWYQSADVGNFLSLPLLESQYHYQTSIEESVVVIYDTQKSARGFLTLKAYRLTPQAIEMYKEGEFTPEALLKLKIGYENLFIEVPIVVRNSALTNIMMSELSEMVPEEDGTNFLDLGTASVLEGQLRCLMDRVDELNQEAIKFNRYQQLVNRQQQDKHRYLQKRAQENAARAAKDEPPLPEEDINKLFRPQPVPPRLNPMIVAGQIDTYSRHISQFCSQSLAKLYITQALQTAKEAKST